MSDDERDIRAQLEAEAKRAPRPQGLRRATVRRGIGGRVGVVALPLLIVASVAWVAVDQPWAEPRVSVAEQAPAVKEGLIAFARFGEGIVKMNPDGSGIAPLITDEAHGVTDLAWAPDGSFMAFHGYFAPADNEEGALFIVRPDGSGLQQLTTRGGERPSWSPDTREVTYHDDGRIYVVNIASGDSRPLVLDADEAEWSPQGDRLLFVNKDGTFHISERDGSREVVLPVRRIDSRPARPDWSPDGTRIAFTQYTGDGPEGTISIMNADGSGERVLTAGSSPTWSPGGSRIAFTRIVGNASHVYSINVDGTDERQLTFGEVADHSPDWGTPAGDEADTALAGDIAFISDEHGGAPRHIYVMSRSGERTRVDSEPGYSSRVSWSPDGRLVIDRGLSEGHGILVLIDPATQTETVLLSDEGRPELLHPQSPQWSPDGSLIAFNSGAGDIYTIRPDGSNLRALDIPKGSSNCMDTHPSWSPDARRLVLVRSCGSENSGLYIAGLRGGEPERLTSRTGEGQPAWSPDGRTIAFTRQIGSGGEIFVFDLETGQETQITDEPDSYSPSWSSDGSQIVFGSNRTGDQDIWLMTADGSNQTPLTSDGINDLAPAFRPAIDGSDRLDSKPIECPPIDIASDEYGLQTWQRLADPGTRVFVGGPTRRGEDGRWAASDRLELWWNTDTPGGEPIADGPALNVSTVTDMDGCFFDTDFQVPNAKPGRYHISAFIFDSSGYGQFGTWRFEVPEPRYGGGDTGYQIARARITNYTDGGNLIIFDAIWFAEGEPRSETCHYEIQDGTGHQLTEGDFKLDVEGRNIEQPFDVPQGEEPQWLELFCAGEMF